MHRLADGGDLVTAIWTADYGDGVPSRNMTLFAVRDGRIVRQGGPASGPRLEPPAWRKDLAEVEPLPKP